MFSSLSKKTLGKALLTKDQPVYVQFYVTARCNLTCEQCNIIYSNADVPMYPVKHGIQKTLKMMNIYTFLMIISTNLLFVFGFAGMIFFVTSNILNSYFAFQLIKLNKSKNLKKDSIKLFGFSIIYLFLIFLFTVIDRFF